MIQDKVQELRVVGKLRRRTRDNVEQTRAAVDDVTDVRALAQKGEETFEDVEYAMERLEAFGQALTDLAAAGLYQSAKRAEAFTDALTKLRQAIPYDADALTELVETCWAAEAGAEEAANILDQDGASADDRDGAFFEAVGQADNLADAIDGLTAAANMDEWPPRQEGK